ncbi:MAG: anti-sigma factor [Saprospiraceae bacterium]|nr:anti-sigma factor [Saprospiraceae bacterium]
MKKNIPSDHLEDFLKKSFEGYAESPPDKVWDNIASEMETPVTPGGKIIILYKWLIGVAAALVLGIVAYQLLDVKTELKELQQQVEQHDSTLQEMQAPSVKSDVSENEKHDKNITQPITEASSNNDKTKYDTSASNNINKQELKSKTLPLPKRSTQESKNIASAQNQGKNDVKIPIPIIANNEKNSTNKSLNTEISNSNIITSIENKTENSINKNAERLAITAFNKLTVLEMPFVSTNHKIELPYNYPITSVLKKNNFFVGVQFLPMKSWGEVTAVSRRPGFPGREKNFSQNAHYAGESLLGGLNIGTKLGQSWSVESGLYYRTASHSATTRPEFQFQDRHPRHLAIRDLILFAI